MQSQGVGFMTGAVLESGGRPGCSACHSRLLSWVYVSSCVSDAGAVNAPAVSEHTDTALGVNAGPAAQQLSAAQTGIG